MSRIAAVLAACRQRQLGVHPIRAEILLWLILQVSIGRGSFRPPKQGLARLSLPSNDQARLPDTAGGAQVIIQIADHQDGHDTLLARSKLPLTPKLIWEQRDLATKKSSTNSIGDTMIKLNRQQIHERALRVLDSHRQGIRWSDLLRTIQAEAPETPQNSIHGAIHNLLTTRTSEIVKVARGTYQLAKYIEADDFADQQPTYGIAAVSVASEAGNVTAVTEQDFYGSFAQWLEDNDEATVASVLGGASLGGNGARQM